MTMSKLISYQFNIDTACVELVFDDRSQISIDFTAVENEVADNRFQRSELDYLIYNDPLAYADLILNSKLNKFVCQPISAARAWSMSFCSVSACFFSVMAPTMGSPTILPLRSTT